MPTVGMLKGLLVLKSVAKAALCCNSIVFIQLRAKNGFRQPN